MDTTDESFGVSRGVARILGNIYDRGAIAVLRVVAVASLAEAAMRLAGAFIRDDNIICDVQLFIDLET